MLESVPAQPPRIAVIIPAYGVAHLVPEALNSLLAQSLTDWEAIIIDDGAPDDVRGAVIPFLGDPRIRFIASDNAGVSTARNRAIQASTAPYIALLDGDDLFRPDYLQQMVAALDARDDTTIVTCNARVFGAVVAEGLVVSEDQNRQPVGTLQHLMERSLNIYIGSSFRRRDFDRVGGFDPEMSHSEDLDFWARLLIGDGHVVYLDQVLADYRVRPESASTNRLKLLRGLLRVYDKVIAASPGTKAAIAAAHARDVVLHDEQLEDAIMRIIDGDTKSGLARLQEYKRASGNPVWTLALLLWRVAPSLAAPMLSWRKERHGKTRGAALSSLASADAQP